MVYESDFYTTRRPYTRPISSHYTVTNPGAIIRPMPPLEQQQVRTFPHHLPYIAHKKLVSVVHTPYPVVFHTRTVPVPIRIYSRVRPSIIAAELQRIRDLHRSSNVSYVSRYLNSKDSILFDDEAREIRARADSLLRRIHVFVPRPSSSDFAEVILPERMRSDDYIRRVLTARKNTKKDEIETPNWYESPEHRQFGHGNLAAVSYTGGKPHSRRRPYYKLTDLRPADVQSDVNLLSFYAKNRQAAASAYPELPLTEREQRKARALADDRPYAAPRKASPDPEHIYKPDLATVYEPEPVKYEREIPSIPQEEVIAEPEPESEPVKRKQKTERVSKRRAPRAIVEPEPVPVEEIKPVEPQPEPEIIQPEPQPTVEPEPAVESEITEAEPEIIEAQQEIVETESVVEAEPLAEPVVIEESVPESVFSEPEVAEETLAEVDAEPVVVEEQLTNTEPEPEQLTITESQVEQVTEGEAEDETPAIEAEPQPTPVEQAETDENQEDDDVLQRKLDEEELRRQVEELKRQAEEEKRRQAEEARLAEERWKAEIEERARLEEEARQARFREIEEQERLQAEMQAEEARIMTERLRDLKIAEEQKRAAEYEAALALEEEERYVIEKAAEEVRKRQEQEEKLASEVAFGDAEDFTVPESTSPECQCHSDVKSQDREERVDSPDADDDTQIEEEANCLSTDHDEVEDHYDGEHEGFNSVHELDTPVEVIPQVEEISSEEDNEDA